MAKAPVKDQAKHTEPEHVKPVEKPVEKPAEPVTHAKTDKSFLDAIEKQHEAEKTVKLRVQPGTDEINHDGVIYRVAQGPAAQEWTVEVPAHVAEHVIRQGGALQLDVPPPPIPDQGEGFVTVRHVSGEAKLQLSHGQNLYETDKDGKTRVPASILAEIEPHGFTPC